MSTIPERRSFLLGAALGLGVAAVPAALLLRDRFARHTPVAPVGKAPVPLAMPGRFPGRVIEARDERSVTPTNRIVPEVVSEMVDRGMAGLVGGDPRDVAGNWKTFFGKEDYVGIKVNPVGKATQRHVGAISSPALLVRVVECLKAAGVDPRRIFVFERYAEECAEVYGNLMTTRPLDGVRWVASAVRYTGTQVAIDGFDEGRDSCSPELARHVVGYDPDVFSTMGYCSRDHDPKDDRRFRSHLSTIVTKLVDKVITLPVLKDHRSAGVTLALKNLSHGMNNNVARSHLSGIAHGVFDGTTPTGPNQCNTFIPQAAGQLPLRQKATLHILDGLIGVYEGGPGSWNRTWGTWRHKGLFFATDPVAMDHVGWTIIDAKRRALGWPAVAEMGLQNYPYDARIRAAMAAFTTQGGIPAATLALASDHLLAGRGSEVFNLRQPEHIVLAGEMGLGEFDRNKIDYRTV